MTVRELEVRWNLSRTSGAEPRARESSIQVTAPSLQEAPEFLAKLVIQGSSGEPVACLPENPFVSLPEVAGRVEPLGVRHLMGGFVVPAGSADGLRGLFDALECESLEMAYGGAETIQKLKEAVRPPGWWRLSGQHSRTALGCGLKGLMSFSASHGSLEVVGERSLVLKLFDALQSAPGGSK